ncbi:MAG TPA: sugar ABC transporter ATP-binding protein [Spirochaetia bacterium]|nr:sugar ABC transporter ATP-binding protein [Spirochaetia bacterium]
MDPYVLEARNISKSFNGVPVLSGVDFRLGRGEVHAIVGQNGAGKSTLMKIINGVYTRDGGEILVEGKACRYESALDAQKAGIGMVYQDFSLVPTMTVSQNVFLAAGRSLQRGPFLDDRAMRERTMSLLADIGVDVEINPNTLVGDLSVGSRQIVEIAKARALDSRILILDEPTASLSSAEMASLFAVIQRLKARGISIVYITHYLRDIFRICDSVTVLRDGKVALSSPISDTDMGNVISAMIGKAAETGGTAALRPVDRTGQPLLEASHMSTRRIRDISFSLWPGEVLGLAGLLGSGRTELLRALYGLDPLTAGTIRMRGRVMTLRSTADAKRAGFALVPEDRRSQGLIMDFSIRENIVLSILRRLRPAIFLNDAKGLATARAYVEEFSIKADSVEQAVKFLSGGNQQKVVIAKNAADEPAVLLLDDPTFGIDIKSKRDIMNIVRAFVDRGNAAIFVSSELEEIGSFCDRTLVIRRGEVTSSISNRDASVSEETLLHLVQ